MGFRFETDYDRKALTALCRALRLSVRKKHSRRTRIFGLCVMIVGILMIALSLKNQEPWSISNTITAAAVLILLVVLCREDQLNAQVSQRDLLPGTDHAVSVFGPEGYETTTEAAASEFRYDAVQCICETPDYFVLFLGKRHGQLFDKHSLTGGTLEGFRAFLTEKTGKTITNIK